MLKNRQKYEDLVPGLLLVPLSSGTPTKHASRPSLVDATGSLIILAIPSKYGEGLSLIKKVN